MLKLSNTVVKLYCIITNMKKGLTIKMYLIGFNKIDKLIDIV